MAQSYVLKLEPVVTTTYISKKTKKKTVKTPRNKFELSLDKQLYLSGAEYAYESEKLPYTIYGNYIPDFIISLPSGSKRYIEAKGFFRPEHKVKMIAVKRQHPDLDIRIVFYSMSKKNIRWADKYGFPYSIGKIPEEWLK